MSKSSIRSCEKIVGYYIAWLVKQNVTSDQASYTDVLAFMKQCQRNGVTQRTVQNYLNMIRHFYDYRIEEQRVDNNPVTGIKIQGVKRKSLYYIFQPQELHAMYNHYPSATLKNKQDKVLLGFLVYQGMKVEDINKLMLADLKLKEGKIEVPGGRKTNSRVMTLESFQMLELYEYVNNVRGEILKKSNEQTDKLFVAMVGAENMNNYVTRIIVKLRMQFKDLKNSKQIRASVITKWLKQYNLREVQYLAGHRYISSTEAYKQNEIEGLTEEVNKYHPLG